MKVTGKLNHALFTGFFSFQALFVKVTGKLNHALFTGFFSSQTLFVKITGKLNYAQQGTYFIYRGAVSGSNARMSPSETACLIVLEIVPVDVCSIPNRFRSELFVR